MKKLESIIENHPVRFCLSLILLQLLTQQLTAALSQLLEVAPIAAKFAENAVGLVVVIIFAKSLSHITIYWLPRQALWSYLLPALYAGINLFGDVYSHNLQAWMLGLGSALMTGLLEEWLCRGLIFTLLLNAFSKQECSNAPLKAILVSAFLFGGAHLANIISEPENWQAILAQTIYASMIGIGFAGVYWFSGGLLLLVLIHATINALDFVTTPDIEPATTVSHFSDYIPVIVIFIPLAVLGIYLGLKKPSKADNLSHR